MRIRKNKKLPSFPGQTVHICRLNQSTWDADPLPDEAYTFDYEDSFNGNGSIGDSIGVVESVATMVGSKEEAITKVGSTVIEDDDDDNNDGMKIAGRFEESDREVLLKSCNENNKSDGGPAEDYDNRLTGSRRGRGRATSKKGSSSALISNEFWYYSGFRPSRGRRRSGGDNAREFSHDLMVENNNGSVVTTQNNLTVSCYSQFDNDEEFDYVYDDEEDDEEEDDNRRKRMRKPIKERSLKSLM